MCRAAYRARNVLPVQPRRVESSSEGLETLTATGCSSGCIVQPHLALISSSCTVAPSKV